MSLGRSLGLLAAGALVLYAMRTTLPGYAEITNPITVAGEVGKPAKGREFALQVGWVKPARQLVYEKFGERKNLTTSGIWVVVDVIATALMESGSISFASWQGPNGASYTASARVPGSTGLLNEIRLEPGFEARGRVIFEIPRGQLNGAEMLIARSAFTPLDSQFRISMPDFSDADIADQINLSER